jgi:hypothetical protein
MLPAVQIFSIEQLLPLRRVTFAGVFVGGVRQRRETGNQKNAHNKSF